MNNGQSTLERAFELARSGTCRSIDDIRRQLSREGFELVHAHVSGGMVTKQLKAAMTLRMAQAASPEAAVMPEAAAMPEAG